MSAGVRPCDPAAARDILGAGSWLAGGQLLGLILLLRRP